MAKMEFPRQITVIQAAAILISSIIGVGVLEFPRVAVEAAGPGAPLATALGFIIAFFNIAILVLVGMRFPNQSIIGYGEEILGKWPGRIGISLIVLYFIALTGLNAREFGEVVVTGVLKRTPLEATVIIMLLLAMLPTRNDSATFAYIHLFYLPFIIAPGLMIVILSLKNASFNNLLPIWGNPSRYFLTNVFAIAALFQTSFILSILMPLMRRPQKAMIAAIWGMSVAGGIYILIVVAAVAVFGSEEIRQLIWPTLELARTTSLPANVLERLDALFLIVWVTAVFTTLYTAYYLTIHAAAEMFRLRDHRMLSSFLLPFIFLAAMLPKDIILEYRIIRAAAVSGLLVTGAYPLLLLIVAVIRRKRGESRAE
jgi:spore germination protein